MASPDTMQSQVAERTSLAWSAFFQRELILAERRKSFLLTVFMGVMAALVGIYFAFVDEDFSRVAADSRQRFLVPAMFAAAGLCEFIYHRHLTAVLREGRRHATGAAYLACLIEVSIPTVMLIGAVGLIGPGLGLNTPPMVAYGLFIALSALRLDPLLCLAAGVTAGVEYMILFSLLADEVRLPPLAGSYLATDTAYLGRALMFILMGVAAAFVAGEIRRRLRHALQVQEQHNWVVGVFGRYVTDEVVDVLLNSPDGLKLGGEKRELTVMMTDLRGFSSLSNRLEPEAVVAMLNHYLAVMTDIIVQYGGTIDEFIGDAILVIFGAPVERADHAGRAVACALAMQSAMPVVNAENRARGLPEVEMGIGINTGTVVVGNIGSEKRGKFGVVGTTVNLAARIESCTVGGQVLISQATRSALGCEVESGETLQVKPKGASEIMDLHDILGLGAPWCVQRPQSEEAVLELETPVALTAQILEGKQPVGEPRSARLLAVSANTARLELSPSPPRLTELSLQTGAPDETFVRVLQTHPGGVTVRCTYRGPESQKLWKEWLGQATGDSVLA